MVEIRDVVEIIELDKKMKRNEAARRPAEFDQHNDVVSYRFIT